MSTVRWWVVHFSSGSSLLVQSSMSLVCRFLFITVKNAQLLVVTIHGCIHGDYTICSVKYCYCALCCTLHGNKQEALLLEQPMQLCHIYICIYTYTHICTISLPKLLKNKHKRNNLSATKSSIQSSCEDLGSYCTSAELCQQHTQTLLVLSQHRMMQLSPFSVGILSCICCGLVIHMANHLNSAGA